MRTPSSYMRRRLTLGGDRSDQYLSQGKALLLFNYAVEHRSLINHGKATLIVP